ncbi:hypothetical protein [Microvirga subterranea]|uniref:hypothetical protein n=1 Tax=Microvirga subterranea TaxID=186651 RepID=UPI0011C05E2E|nr:hypothetical protein [Microvirga subterranea]
MISVRCSDVTFTLPELDVLPVVVVLRVPLDAAPPDVEPDVDPAAPPVWPDEVPLAPPDVPPDVVPEAPPEVPPEPPPVPPVPPLVPPEVDPDAPPLVPPVSVEAPPEVPPEVPPDVPPPLGDETAPPPLPPPVLPEEPPLVWAMAAALNDRAAAATVANIVIRIEFSPSTSELRQGASTQETERIEAGAVPHPCQVSEVLRLWNLSSFAGLCRCPETSPRSARDPPERVQRSPVGLAAGPDLRCWVVAAIGMRDASGVVRRALLVRILNDGRRRGGYWGLVSP